MKFQKEFAAEMVPEWQEEYMDYNKLKSSLKEIQQFRERYVPPAAQGGIKRKQTPSRTFSGLTEGYPHYPSPLQLDIENQPILSNSVNQDGTQRYETTFLLIPVEGGECELFYFKRLDDEFNKVEQFYRSKVEELRKEADVFEKQMDAFIAFRIKVENTTLEFDRSVEMAPLATDVPTTTAALSASTPRGTTLDRNVSIIMEAIHKENIQREEQSNNSSDSKLEEKRMNLQNGSVFTVMEAINEESTQHEEQSDDSSEFKLEEKKMNLLNASVSKVMEATDLEIMEHEEQSDHSSDSGLEEKTSNQKVEEQKPKNRSAPVEVLNRVRINNTLKKPCPTMRQDQGELSYSRKKLKKVEQRLERALLDFRHNLGLLQSYSFQNILAFSKIMKNYDKITSRGAAEVYMSMMAKSYIGSNEEVTKLIEWVDKAFTKLSANSNHSKGTSMILSSSAKREKHAITFSTAFFAGCTICLLVALILIVCTHKLYKQPGTTQYMATMFLLYGLFVYIVLHILMYAVNIYLWRRYKINYSFIFGFKKGQKLGQRGVLLLGFGIAVLALSSVLAKLGVQINPNIKDNTALTEFLPLILLLSLIVILLWPFNVIYPLDRIYFLRCLFRCIRAPFYGVTFPDSFFADQFTSQVQALRSLEFYICYYGWGDYKIGQSHCKDYTIFLTFSFILATIPYWSRFLQCLRRFFEEKDLMQGCNGLRYFVTIAAVSLRTAYSLDGGKGWQVLAYIFSAAAAVFSTYWDLVVDWGLLQRNSKNPWLRDKLLIPHKTVYFAAIVLNVLLRFAWLPTILNLKFSLSHGEAMLCLFASLEIIRRGIWNFFRVEMEHLNNVRRYRAFKSVPLPLNYEGNEDEDQMSSWQ